MEVITSDDPLLCRCTQYVLCLLNPRHCKIQFPLHRVADFLVVVCVCLSVCVLAVHTRDLLEHLRQTQCSVMCL